MRLLRSLLLAVLVLGGLALAGVSAFGLEAPRSYVWLGVASGAVLLGLVGLFRRWTAELDDEPRS